MLADEAFALHFLEDTYAAGHVAGAWGDVSQRKGTHDYYNEAGLEVFTWSGGSESVVLMGDAHMRPEDADRAAAAVRISLEQLIDHAAGRERRHPAAAHARGAGRARCASTSARTTCSRAAKPALRATPEAIALAPEVLGPTPVPGLGPGLGSMPRFRAEVGPFIGFVGSGDVRMINGGYDPSVTSNGWIGGADLSLRAGLGLDGVIGESGDGLVFASLGVRGDTRSSNTLPVSSPALEAAGGAVRGPIALRHLHPAAHAVLPHPGRPAVRCRRCTSFSPETYTGMAVTASNGGLIPWQSGWATRFGRFQFVLGRELGATFYGYGFENTMVVPGATPGAEPRVVDFKSILFDLPILEYRPYRAFDTRQSSAVLIQLYRRRRRAASSTTVTWPPGAPGVKLETIYSIGVAVDLRLAALLLIVGPGGHCLRHDAHFTASDSSARGVHAASPSPDACSFGAARNRRSLGSPLATSASRTARPRCNASWRAVSSLTRICFFSSASISGAGMSLVRPITLRGLSGRSASR